MVKKYQKLLSICLLILTLSLCVGGLKKFQGESVGVDQVNEPKSALAFSSFTCNAKPGSSENNYIGEHWQTLTLTSTWDETITTAEVQHDMAGGGLVGYTVTDLVPGKTIQVNVTLYATGTFQFRMNASAGAAYVHTQTITVTISTYSAPYFNPNDRSLSVTQKGQTAQLSWPEAPDNVGIQYYTVYRSTSSFSDPTDAGVDVVNSKVSSNSWTDTSVTMDTQYWYCVSAQDYTGNTTMASWPGEPTKQHTIVQNIFLDGTTPSVEKFEVETGLGVSVVDANKRVLLPKGEDFEFSLNVTEEVYYLYMEINSSARRFSFETNRWERPYLALLSYHLTWKTKDITDQRILLDGTYNITVILRDAVGNEKVYVYANAVRVGERPVEIPWGIIITIIAVAAGGAIGTLGVLKVRAKRKVEEEVQAVQKKRKGQIYKGASALGKKSGQEAESLVRKRKRSPEKVAPTAPKSEKARITRQKTESKSTPVSPRELKPVKMTRGQPTSNGKAGTSRGSTPDTSSNIDLARKMDFVNSKVDSLDMVMQMATLLVEQVPDRITCPECGKELASHWASCPWCRIEDNRDELGMKASMRGMQESRSQCPKCGRILVPSWGGSCPYCLTK